MAAVLLKNHIELPSLRIALLLVPKVATSSIRHAVFESGVQATFNMARNKIHADYYKIAIVRNTWDRLVSCWHQKCNARWPWKAAHLGDSRLVTGMPFQEFLHVVCEDIRANHHFYPQHEIVGTYDELWTADELDLRWYERFPNMPIGHDNVNPYRTAAWATYYDAKTLYQVAESYADEIMHFGFEFSGVRK